MDLFEALKGRRSVRAYKDEQIKQGNMLQAEWVNNLQ